MTNARRALKDYERSLMPQSNTTATATASVGFPIATAAVFVMLVLKVAGMAGASWGLANLSWWWVFSPWLIGLAFTAVLLIVMAFFALLYVIFGK